MTKFTKHFPEFVCDGDSISCTVDGIDYTARLERDYDSDPHDYDAPGWCFDTAGDAAHSAQVRRNVARNKRILDAWDRDEWQYFGVVIDAEHDGWSKPGITSMWGIEGNFPSRAKNPNKYLRAAANDLLTEVILNNHGDILREAAAHANPPVTA